MQMTVCRFRQPNIYFNLGMKSNEGFAPVCDLMQRKRADNHDR
jgi:hypothetical protein